MGSPAISPDGKAIAYTLTSTDWSEEIELPLGAGDVKVSGGGKP